LESIFDVVDSVMMINDIHSGSFAIVLVECFKVICCDAPVIASLLTIWVSRHCAWGVLWEIARHAAIKTIDFQKPVEIDVFRRLEGTNQAVGPSVRRILLKEPPQKDIFAPHFSAEIEAQVKVLSSMFAVFGLIENSSPHGRD
jgi:hypothetical protein